jgi:hypothetical protein
MTAFFEYFPKVTHLTNVMTNIVHRIDFFENIKDNAVLYEYINIRNNEKPEDLAFRLYGDAELYWIILYANNIYDPFYGWLLNDKRLYEYVLSKYGSDDIYSIHHYETTSSHSLGAGVKVDSTEPFSEPVTNYRYEELLNEEKRQVKVIKQRFISQIMEEYKAVF